MMAILTEQMRKDAEQRRQKEAQEVAQYLKQCTDCIPHGKDFPEEAVKFLADIAPVQLQRLNEALERNRKRLALQATIAEALAEVPPDKNMGFELQRRTNKLLIAILLKLHES